MEKTSRLNQKSWDVIQLNDFACPPIMLKAGAVLPSSSKGHFLREPSANNLNLKSKRYMKYFNQQLNL